MISLNPKVKVVVSRAIFFLKMAWFYLRLLLSTAVDFLPIFLTLLGVGASVIHNVWAADEERIYPFILDQGRKIYRETHVYYTGDRITLCLSALCFILLCFPRWSDLKKMYLYLFKILLALEVFTLVDYCFSGNKDILNIAGFDTNTIKLIVYMICIGSLFMKRLNERLNYVEGT